MLTTLQTKTIYDVSRSSNKTKAKCMFFRFSHGLLFYLYTFCCIYFQLILNSRSLIADAFYNT